LSDDFFAAVLGELGTPDEPTVYLQHEGRFYRFDPKAGVYVEQSRQQLAAIVSNHLRQGALACATASDTTTLRFKLASTSRLNSVVERAKGLLPVPADFFDAEPGTYFVVGNGVIQLPDRKLVPFHPKFRRRSKLAVDHVPNAVCPMLNDLLCRALCSEDLDLFQRWCGLLLVGVNLAQVVMVLEGPAGSGKGTVARVLSGLLGPQNLAALRTSLLGERFEIGGLLGRTLLYGADVRTDFLTNRSATVLKSLTGGDPMTVELKGVNDRPQITARFNVLLTCNARLKVRLDGDADAWRRRLHFIRFGASTCDAPITDLSEQILQAEGAGVLNFMLDGLDRLRADGFNLRRTPRQQAVVEDLLREAGSVGWFVSDYLILNPGGTVTVADAYDAYVRCCADQGWGVSARDQFSEHVKPIVEGRFGVAFRHDVRNREGKPQRGWKGVALK
jgi:putative DNA primase/helicase